MTTMIFKNSTEDVTLEDAIRLYELGVATIINDEKDVTFEIETVSTSEERNMERH